MLLVGGQGDDPTQGCRSSMSLFLRPSNSPLTDHFQTTHTKQQTQSSCCHVDQSTGWLPPLPLPFSLQTAVADTFPVLFLQDKESHCDLRASKYINHSQIVNNLKMSSYLPALLIISVFFPSPLPLVIYNNIHNLNAHPYETPTGCIFINEKPYTCHLLCLN